MTIQFRLAPMLDDFYLSMPLGLGKNNLRRLEAQRNELNSKVRQLRPHLRTTESRSTTLKDSGITGAWDSEYTYMHAYIHPCMHA